jgi:hypothetical protein
VAIKNAPSAGATTFVDCAMAGCTRKARVKAWRKAWLNLCAECHAELTLAEAREYCRKVGVHGRAQALEFIRRRVVRIGRSPETVDDREPGADESERALEGKFHVEP